jgi:ubiquinone/menaquinone biosynthesis C-methylase UbiE
MASPQQTLKPSLDRIKSEQDFHNARFGAEEDFRKKLDKYYLITKEGDRKYCEMLNKLASDRDVLEYGCGEGTSAVQLLKIPNKAKSYHGIDISDEGIASARRKSSIAGYNNCSFETMNAEELKFQDATFDLVYGKAIIHHLDLNKCFAEVWRVLKPGGTAVFLEPLGHNPILNWYRSRTPSLRTPDEHPLLASDMELAKRTFSEVNVEFFGLFTAFALPFQATSFSHLTMTLFSNLDRVVLRAPGLKWWAWYSLWVFRK